MYIYIYIHIYIYIYMYIQVGDCICDIISKCGTCLVIYQISYAESGRKALLH